MRMLRSIKKFALKSRHPYFKHATLILHDSRVVAWGINHTHIHSERNAAAKIKGTLEPFMILNIRVTKTGLFANSKPCEECEKYLRKRGAIWITYSTPTGFKEEWYV